MHGLVLLLAAAATSWILVGALRRRDRLGGLGFVAAFVLVVSLLMAHGLVSVTAGLAATLPGLAVALLGLIRDRLPLPVRIAGQTLAALAVVALTGTPSYDLFVAVLPPGLPAAVLTVSGLVWCMNLYPRMDGVDGMAAVQGLTGFLFSAFVVGPPGLVFAILAAVLAGFLPWNLPPARVVMGAGAAGFLGCQLGLAIILAAQASPRLVWLPVVLFALFVADATLTLVGRLLAGHDGPRPAHAYEHQLARWGHGRVTAAVALLNMAVLTPLALLASASAVAVPVALGGAALVVRRLGAGREAPPEPGH